MADSYLEIAEHILTAQGRPMSAQQIIENARKYGLLPSRLSGATMEKTLQARIAEDIFAHRNDSAFYRTAQGVYFLRAGADDVTLPPNLLSEFPTTQRHQSIGNQRVLHIQKDQYYDEITTIESIIFDNIITSYNRYEYINNNIAGYAPVLVFCLILCGDHILTSRVGRYSFFSEIYGECTTGFRRFVDEFDIDLLDSDNAGISRASVRSCSHYLDFSSIELDDLKFQSKLTRQFSLYDPSTDRYGIVVSVRFPRSSMRRLRIKRRLDLTGFAWRKLADLADEPLDAWSSTAIRKILV